MIRDRRFLGDHEVISRQEMVGRLEQAKVREGSGRSCLSAAVKCDFSLASVWLVSPGSALASVFL